MSETKLILYFFHFNVLFLGKSTDTKVHRHHLVQILVSLGGPFRFKYDTIWHETHALILDADRDHQLDAGDNWIAIFLLDSESDAARLIRKSYLRDTGLRKIDKILFALHLPDLEELIRNPLASTEAETLFNRIIGGLICNDKPAIHINEKIQRVIKRIRNLHEKKASIHELAELIGISESRLMHLFSEEVGIPIRQYLLWCRLRDALRLITTGISFTDAAHEAGFSDSAHLSRTFKKMFGVTLLEIFKNYKNSRFIQVIISSD
jgi:AraC-like DNA-binding protein